MNRSVRQPMAWMMGLAFIAAAVMTLGCADEGATTASRPESVANEWVVDAIPGAISITEVAESLTPSADGEAEATGEAKEGETSDVIASASEVTLVGKIDAGQFDPFDATQATFLMMELPDPEHATDDPDHADNCPFCKRRALKAPKAMVRFVNESGEPIGSSASTLVGVQAGDTVTVQGKATFEPNLNLVTIDAAKIAIE